MARNKNFKSDANPAMSFISKETIEAVDGKPTHEEDKPPKGYKINPKFIETKSKRVQLLIQPSTHEAIKAKAKAEGISVNEAMNIALKEYIEG